MIELSLLEQLAGFAAYGTLSETARKLHTSQPALTRSMIFSIPKRCPTIAIFP